MNLVLLLFGYFDFVSHPLNNHTAYYNPGALSGLAAYEILVAPRDVGTIDFYSFSARFGPNGLGFSGSQSPYALKNWFSVSRQVWAPLSAGINLGIEGDDGVNRPSVDVGVLSTPWGRRPIFLPDSRLVLGLVGYDLFSHDHRALRGGVSYFYRALRVTAEVEDSMRNHTIIPYAGFGARLTRTDLAAEAGVGFERKYLAAGFCFNVYNFGLGLVYRPRPEPDVKFFLSLVFKERLVERIVVREKVVEKTREITVEKPIYIDRIIEKSPEKKYTKLTLKQKRYCETHYQLGIKFYTEGKLKEAIAEWERVYAVAPDYENVATNLVNTREKLKKIENNEDYE